MADGNDENDPNSWMVTFGDLIMLLLTFFVLLLTMKSMDSTDTQEMFEYFIEVEQVMEGDGYQTIQGKPVQDSQRRKQVRYITSNAMVKKTLKESYKNFRKYFDVDEDERGVVVTLDSEHLFEPGRADIRRDGYSVLDMAGDLLSKASNDVLILGHTDNVPIKRGRFRSNWDLSCYRALSVFNYLTDSYGIPPGQLAPGGYGDTRPLKPNTSDENRAKNRRVEFILKKK